MARGQVAYVCHEYGDAGLLVDLVADDYEARWTAAQTIGQAMRTSPRLGVVDVVASYDKVFVAFDPLTTTHDALTAEVEGALARQTTPLEPRRFSVPVLYGGEAGPDLVDVAELCALSPDQVIEAHTGSDWVVRFVGSPLGAPMLDGPRMPRSIPRLASPRARLAPGSVGLSGFQSIIYNAASPGGWRLIGRTPATLFDVAHAPHVAYRPGDRLRFVPIAPDEWQTWRRPIEAAA